MTDVTADTPTSAPLSFADLAPSKVTVTVDLPAYGRKVTVALVLPTWVEWQRVETELPLPPVPRTLAGKGGEKLPNPADRDYLTKCADIQEERNYRRLALAMSKAGNDVPGDTIEAKARALRDIDAGVAVALINFLQQAVGGGYAQGHARAESF